MLLWPLLSASWLAIHVPVAVWAGAAVRRLDVALFVLNDLVLVLGNWVLMTVEDWIVNGEWVPVAVVGAPLCLIALLTGRCWSSISSWVGGWWRPRMVVGLAGSNDGVLQVVLEWYLGFSERISAVW